MSSLRLVLVTRRFWPLVGGAEIAMANLAAALSQRGHHVTLLTARWHPEWPASAVCRGAPVVRLPQPRWRVWGTWRYMRALSGWLASHRGQFDLVYVSMLKHDAYAALSVARRARFPVVVRAEGAGLTGDVHWQLEARFGRQIKRRVMRADALVAPSARVEAELIAAGYPRQRIGSIANGVPIPPPREESSQQAARAALAEVSPALALPTGAPLAVYTGRLDAAKGLTTLVAAWPEVVAHEPEARLWLVGEGPLARQIGDQARALGLEDRVVLPGAFDDVQDVLRAADLFVLPSAEENMSMALLEAMALGLPVVASDIAGNRALIRDGQHGRLVGPGDAAALAAAVIECRRNPRQAADWGRAARARVEAEFSVERMAGLHVALFERLLAGEPAWHRPAGAQPT